MEIMPKDAFMEGKLAAFYDGDTPKTAIYAASIYPPADVFKARLFR